MTHSDPAATLADLQALPVCRLQPLCDWQAWERAALRGAISTALLLGLHF